MKVAVLGVFVKNVDSIVKLNEILHRYRENIIGRMGLPNVDKDLNVITLVIKAPEEAFGFMIKDIDKLKGVSANLNYSNF